MLHCHDQCCARRRWRYRERRISRQLRSNKPVPELSGRQRNSRFGQQHLGACLTPLSFRGSRTLSSWSTRPGRLRRRRPSAAQCPASLTSRPDPVPARKRKRPSTARAVANCHGPRRVLSGFGHAAQKSLIERTFIYLERLSSPSDERFQLFIRGICVEDKPQLQAFETHRHGRSPQPALGARSCANADSA